MKLFAVVVVYHPETDELLKNIDRYIDKVDHVVVYCNSDECIPALEVYGERITVLGAGGGNVGIARAINEAIRWGYARGYEFIMTMDQDSYWEDIDTYLEFIEKDEDESDAIFSPHIETPDGTKFLEHKDFAIQSGAVFRMTIFEKMALFNESYFIYQVDTEFCRRVVRMGYRIVHAGNGKLIHRVGYPTRISKTKYTAENYSPIVNYYITRNSFWLWKEHHHHNDHPMKILSDTFVLRVKHILLGEDKKVAKICAIFKGLFDGVFKNPKSPAPTL